ncbi:hypothetical protein KY320_03065, partial [Candidatus Woesearchaeota archaeon]|nr:hypothetical protein [Candidatus Woesearchaeota archaeon]
MVILRFLQIFLGIQMVRFSSSVLHISHSIAGEFPTRRGETPEMRERERKKEQETEKAEEELAKDETEIEQRKVSLEEYGNKYIDAIKQLSSAQIFRGKQYIEGLRKVVEIFTALVRIDEEAL